MNRDEFLAWSYLLQLVDLSVTLWDVERYNGMGPCDHREQGKASSDTSGDGERKGTSSAVLGVDVDKDGG